MKYASSAARLFALLGVALCLSACGPKPHEIGAALLIIGPACWLLLLLSGSIVQKVAGLRVFGAARENAHLAASLVVAVGLAVMAAVYGGDVTARGTTQVAMIMIAPGAIVLGMLSWRLLQAKHRERSLGLFIWPVMILYYWLPALILLNHRELGLAISTELGQQLALVWWVFPAFYGVPPALSLTLAIWWARRQRPHNQSLAEVADQVSEALS